jgi:flagellar basal body-associated protein FliL
MVKTLLIVLLILLLLFVAYVVIMSICLVAGNADRNEEEWLRHESKNNRKP